MMMMMMVGMLRMMMGVCVVMCGVVRVVGRMKVRSSVWMVMRRRVEAEQRRRMMRTRSIGKCVM